ncbi:hypothetical protein PNOK_0766100 [Pyrrhoderma noxium]|uniref:Uncharacterized protein n=1 Tax=Pyrrhoderma noxium TaxID=2282107 RepID=A0A286U8Y4_9AGAM|nr:hypothetical protein PNOK_0766100 [Pyrrhoderma noxium]
MLHSLTFPHSNFSDTGMENKRTLISDKPSQARPPDHYAALVMLIKVVGLSYPLPCKKHSYNIKTGSG